MTGWQGDTLWSLQIKSSHERFCHLFHQSSVLLVPVCQYTSVNTISSQLHFIQWTFCGETGFKFKERAQTRQLKLKLVSFFNLVLVWTLCCGVGPFNRFYCLNLLIWHLPTANENIFVVKFISPPYLVKTEKFYRGVCVSCTRYTELHWIVSLAVFVTEHHKKVN